MVHEAWRFALCTSGTVAAPLSDIVVMAWPVKPLLETSQSLVRAQVASHSSFVSQVAEHFFLQCFRDHCLKPLREVSSGLQSSAENALVHRQQIPKLEESAHGLACGSKALRAWFDTYFFALQEWGQCSVSQL